MSLSLPRERKIEKIYSTHFGKQTHTYKLDGKKIPGSTTITGAMAKPVLIPWAAKKCAESAKEQLIELISNPDIDLNQVLTKEMIHEICWFAKDAHSRSTKEAGDIGSATHDILERYVIATILKNNFDWDEEFKGKDTRIINSCRNYLTFIKSSRIEFLQAETVLYFDLAENEGANSDFEIVFGGTMDWCYRRIVQLPNSPLLHGAENIVYTPIGTGDTKTSNGIYSDQVLQVTSYSLAARQRRLFENKYPHPDNFKERMIIRFDKEEEFDPVNDVLIRPADTFYLDSIGFFGLFEAYLWDKSYQEEMKQIANLRKIQQKGDK